MAEVERFAHHGTEDGPKRSMEQEIFDREKKYLIHNIGSFFIVVGDFPPRLWKIRKWATCIKLALDPSLVDPDVETNHM